MSSNFESSISSPIMRVPYDVLREIFIQCLPQSYQNRIVLQQPNTTNAPLLLCHICSSWRTVALGSAVLWSHVYFCLTVCREDSRTDLVKSEIDVIRWWKNNQGLVAPFLSLGIRHKDRHLINQELVGNEMPFLLEYLTSAQYLCLDSFFWGRIRERIEAGNRFTFPNLHTLEKFGRDENDPFYSVQALISPHALSGLQRLCLSNDISPPLRQPGIPNHWSSLTDISLDWVSITLDFWPSLIRSLPNLQWVYININKLLDFDNVPSNVPHCTLPRLSTLCVTLNDEAHDAIQSPFRLLLFHIHLPALHTVSLSGRAWSNDNTTAIDELYAVLKRKTMPKVTTLHLGCGFLTLDNLESGGITLGRQVEPFWMHTMHLTQLQLEVPGYYRDKNQLEVEVALDNFFRNILSSNNSWLDLQNTACPIREVLISITGVDLPLDSYIQKYTKKTPNIAFQLVSKTAGDIIAEMWYNWGSNN